MAGQFAIRRFTRDNFDKALTNEHFTQGQAREHKCACYLYGYLQNLKAQTLIEEFHYIDRAYLDDFATYYAKCFQRYNRKCTRLHFFSKEVKLSFFRTLLLGSASKSDEKAFKKSYLGFIVVRPLPEAVIGRTVLRPSGVDGKKGKYPCLRKYKSNLFGIKLTVDSLAFQEQDTVLAACATVSLWCCLHKLTDLFRSPVPTPAEITRAASTVLYHSRTFPSHGLITEQICNAVKHAGLEPEVFKVKKHTPLISLIYGYLRAGLPLILGVQVEGKGMHAIALAGYSLRLVRQRRSEVEDSSATVPMVGLYIDKLYGHDDQFGPFSQLTIEPSAILSESTFPVTFKGSWKDETNKRLTLYPKVLIVPLYYKIRITFLEILAWLRRIQLLLFLILKPEAEPYWDLRLTTTNSFKGKAQRLQISKESLEDVLLKQHPRFIWRATLKLAGLNLLDFLFDATDIERSFPLYYVIWHSEDFKKKVAEWIEKPGMESIFQEILSERFASYLRERSNI